MTGENIDPGWNMRESDNVISVISDRQAIAELENKFVCYRDRGLWSKLRTIVNPEGTISVSWFEGTFQQFVDASIEMAEKGSLVKHILGTPLIRINGNRAISETSAIIMVRGKARLTEVDMTSYTRLYDYLEKTEGKWLLVKRTAIFEKDRIDPVRPSLLFWITCLFTNFNKHPAAYRYLGYMAEIEGHKLAPHIVKDKSNEAELLYKAGEEWLSA